MGIFSRTPRAPGEHVTTRHNERRSHESYSMARRPTFGQWVKGTWLDVLTMAAMGALGLGVSPPMRHAILEVFSRIFH